jgi:predicted O-linked N-acetylglucosamine transferase (SPINDLY family)
MGLFSRRRPPSQSTASTEVPEAATSEPDASRLIAEGNRLEEAGEGTAALDCYDAALRIAPTNARAHMNRGNVLQDLGRIPEALAAYTAAIEQDPGYASAYYNLGNAHFRAGRHDDALAAYRKALELNPGFADASLAAGCVLDDMGRPLEAIDAYSRAITIRPQYAEAHGNLGSALRRLGRLDAAAASYRRALELAPRQPVTHYTFGNVLCEMGHAEQAATSYRNAIALAPEFAEAYFGLANAQRGQERMEDAIASYERAIALKPQLAEAHYNLGNVQRLLGRFEASVASYRRAIESRPDFVDAHHNLGNALTDAGRFEEAMMSQRRALELRPDSVEAWLGLANAQTARGELTSAVESYRCALAIDPSRAMTQHDLGTTLYKLGRVPEAIECFRHALSREPAFAQAWTGLLFCLSHDARVDAAALFEEHVRFGAQFESTPPRSDHRNTRNPERRLRVGVVSADLREHAVAVYCEPVLAELAKSASLGLHAYFNHASGDATTDRLRGHFAHWTDVAPLSDASLAQAIENDGIDILIDLSGHTAGNRLPVFARKPAPIQASWIGYLGTTGLRSMDYYLADPRLFPLPQWSGSFTEKLVSLPAWAAFLPGADAPPVNALPALTNGYLTFGSFNRLSKLGDGVIALWSRALRAVPEARMLLGGMPPPGQYDALVASFAREGIARERLVFHPRCDAQAYLALHHEVDIALDAFPYTGGNTSNHALSMGVPVLTLAGSTPAWRQGAAIMLHAGLPEFVAHDAAQFEDKCAYWASHLDQLAEIRAGLRERLFESAMGRPDLIALALDRALRTMWHRWCAQAPATSFSVDPTKSPPIGGLP